MPLYQKIISTLTAAFIGAAMTMPTPVDLDLPGQIVESTPASLAYRTGVVTNVVESNNVTVAISGSPVLVTASYLFPQYEPMLGDRVYVVKQDGQWFILGTMSGQVNSLAANSSFEDGTIGAVPTNWGAVNTAVAAGVPTTTKQLSTSPLSGAHVMRLALASTANATSGTTINSTLISAQPGQVWAGGAYIRFTDHTGPNQVFISTGLRFYNNALVSLGLFSQIAIQSFTSTTGWTLLRPDSTSLSAIAPAGTAWVSLEIDVLYVIANLNFDVQAELDNAMLRRVG